MAGKEKNTMQCQTSDECTDDGASRSVIRGQCTTSRTSCHLFSKLCPSIYTSACQNARGKAPMPQSARDLTRYHQLQSHHLSPHPSSLISRRRHMQSTAMQPSRPSLLLHLQIHIPILVSSDLPRLVHRCKCQISHVSSSDLLANIHKPFLRTGAICSDSGI